MDRPRGDRGKCFSGPDGSKSGPRGVQERPIRPWKPPLGRPSLFKGSKRPPRDLQEASRAHLAAILAPFWINFEAISMRCCHHVGHVSSLKAPSPRALDPRSQARRNARERLNPPPPTGEPSVLDRALECFWNKLMEVKLESMVNHLEQACAFRRAYGSCCICSASFLPCRLQHRPDRLLRTSKRPPS